MAPIGSVGTRPIATAKRGVGEDQPRRRSSSGAQQLNLHGPVPSGVRGAFPVNCSDICFERQGAIEDVIATSGGKAWGQAELGPVERLGARGRGDSVRQPRPLWIRAQSTTYAAR